MKQILLKITGSSEWKIFKHLLFWTFICWAYSFTTSFLTAKSDIENIIGLLLLLIITTFVIKRLKPVFDHIKDNF